MLFPNPAKEVIFVNFSCGNKGNVIDIYNSYGMPVYKKELANSSGFFYINTEELGGKGFYYLILKNKDKVIHTKNVIIN